VPAEVFGPVALGSLRHQPTDEHVVEARARLREPPLRGAEGAQGRRGHHRDIEVAREYHGLPRVRKSVDEGRRAKHLDVGQALVAAEARRVQVPDDDGSPVVETDPERLADPPLARPGKSGDDAEPQLRCDSLPNAARVEDDRPVVCHLDAGRNEDRVGLSLDRRAEAGRVEVGDDGSEGAAESRGRRDVAVGRVGRPGLESGKRFDCELLQRDDRGAVLADEPDHPLEVAPSPRREGAPMEEVPAPDQHAASVFGVRVVLADPPAYTPYYDHDLATALAAAGADVELVTSRFRFADLPAPTGYVRSELFYPLSSRAFRRSRLRVPVKALEHPLGMLRLRRRPADIVHVQWLSAPQLDERLLRLRAPSVFTAHDLLPRRTASKLDLWRRLLQRFDRVVVHSERGRERLSELGIESHVIPLPIPAASVARRDDGRTLLFAGVIRPYKGLPDALEVVRRIEDARLLVAGDPSEPIDARGDRVEWRLGYLPQPELDRALGEGTVALFPYRPELDQSAALMQALGAGVPAVCYDVGGIAEPVRRFGAGRVVPAGDVDALTEAARELLDDPEALAAARAGAHRARETLTWAASAQAHLELYGELA
jgi:glycosyltransferase involved in cell wall biosynthesis